MPGAARDSICFISKRPATPRMDSTIAREAVSAVQRRGFGKVVRASITEIPYPSDTFDLAYSFEVIDEVSDSDRAIRELYRVLKPGGCLLLRLPAFDWLRSSHDADIGTLHRYTLARNGRKTEARRVPHSTLHVRQLPAVPRCWRSAISEASGNWRRNRYQATARRPPMAGSGISHSTGS